LFLLVKQSFNRPKKVFFYTAFKTESLKRLGNSAWLECQTHKKKTKNKKKQEKKKKQKKTKKSKKRKKNKKKRKKQTRGLYAKAKAGKSGSRGFKSLPRHSKHLGILDTRAK